MKIVLFRHGPAGDPDPLRWEHDRDRPLTARGMDRTRAAARGLRSLVDEASILLTSPYIRALGTAHILAEVFGIPTIETLDALACGGPPRSVLAAVARLQPDQTVILVGHEPDLGNLAGIMIGSTRALPLKKAGAVAVEFEGAPVVGGGRMLWHVPPRLLRQVGRGARKRVRVRTD